MEINGKKSNSIAFTKQILINDPEQTLGAEIIQKV